MSEYSPGDVVRMKKNHPCGENRWEIIRIGMDVKLKCLGCARTVVFKRKKFETGVKGKE